MWEKLDTSVFVTSLNSFLFFFLKKHTPTTGRQVFKHWCKCTLPFKKSTPYYTVHDLLMNYALLILSNYFPNFKELMWICDETGCITIQQREVPCLAGKRTWIQAGVCCRWEEWNWIYPWERCRKAWDAVNFSLSLTLFFLHVLKSVDSCKEAEPKSILLKPVRSQIQ